MNRVLLRAEGLFVLALCVGVYLWIHLSWITLACLILVPDIAMLGYLKNPRVGAATYNVVHSYVLPLILLGTGLALHHVLTLGIGLIWTAHIGMDRMLGYGLKYPSAFQDTHLQRV